MKQYGFSLIEVLCAQALLGTAILILTGCLISAGQSMGLIRQKDSAMMMAQDIKARVNLVVDHYGYLEPADSLFHAGQIQTAGSGVFVWHPSPSQLHHLNGGVAKPVIGNAHGCIIHQSERTGVLLQWPAPLSERSREPLDIQSELSLFQRQCRPFSSDFTSSYLGE